MSALSYGILLMQAAVGAPNGEPILLPQTKQVKPAWQDISSGYNALFCLDQGVKRYAPDLRRGA